MISAIVLAHDDALILGRTLASLSWCDELIVVDDYSVDATVEVAKKYNASIIQHHTAGDFAAQRNFALAKARGDWVLYIDSDEVVSPELREEIERALHTSKSDGFVFRRQDYMYGRPLTHGETGSVRLLRLAKKTAGVWRRPVHEVWDVSGETSELTHPILHYPHANVAQFLADINVYSTLNAAYLYDQKVRVPAWHIPAYPVAKFFRNYVWLSGFKDGVAGAILALMMSFHSFLTRAKLYMLWHGTREVNT